MGMSSANVLSRMNFGDVFGRNKLGDYGFWRNITFRPTDRGYTEAGASGTTLSEVSVGAGRIWESLTGSSPSRTGRYLCGDYRWTAFGESSQVAIIHGLYVSIFPDNPKSGVPMYWAYSSVTVTMSKSLKTEVASKAINSAWNRAINKIDDKLNTGQYRYPFQEYVRVDFNKLFVSYAKLEGAEVYLSAVPFGVPYNDNTISFAKLCDNLFQ